MNAPVNASPNPWHFRCEPDPEFPGWLVYELGGPDAYIASVLGKVLIRAEGPNVARIRLMPQRHHLNAGGNVHGGIAMGLADIAMFAALYVLRGAPVPGSVTIDLTTQFIGPGKASEPLDAVVELLRETKRMGFLRGTVVQGDHIAVAFSGTIRTSTLA